MNERERRIPRRGFLIGIGAVALTAAGAALAVSFPEKGNQRRQSGKEVTDNTTIKVESYHYIDLESLITSPEMFENQTIATVGFKQMHPIQYEPLSSDHILPSEDSKRTSRKYFIFQLRQAPDLQSPGLDTRETRELQGNTLAIPEEEDKYQQVIAIGKIINNTGDPKVKYFVFNLEDTRVIQSNISPLHKQ